jgi:prepilin-type N-terminal cleavage/methylation domain-containing protein/prepilin-type processing-associated H-X9-DG protein
MNKEMNMDPRSPRQAFTLIELLVVISIIAVLAALLLPAINLARSSARTIQCLSSMRQVGMGMQGYADDNAGRLPRIKTADNVHWQELVSPSVEANTTDDPKGGQTRRKSVIWGCTEWQSSPKNQDKAWRVGYSFNAWLMQPEVPWANNNFHGTYFGSPQMDFTFEQLSTLSQRALVADGIDWHMGGKGEGFDPRHRDKGTVLFCDLHVATLRKEDATLAITDPGKLDL